MQTLLRLPMWCALLLFVVCVVVPTESAAAAPHHRRQTAETGRLPGRRRSHPILDNARCIRESQQRSFEKALVLSKFSTLFGPNKPILRTIEAPFLCETFQLVQSAHDRKTDTRFLAYKTASDHYVVTYQGTSTWRNMITNMLAFPRKCLLPNGERCGRYHYGFHRAFRRISEQLKAILRPAKKISFTGHSLGGALGILSAFHLRAEGFPVENVYVFGTPSVGNRKFEAAFAAVQAIEDARFITKKDHLVDAIPCLSLRWFSRPLKPIRYIDCVEGGSCVEEKHSRFTLHRAFRYHDSIRNFFEQMYPGTCACLEDHAPIAADESEDEEIYSDASDSGFLDSEEEEVESLYATSQSRAGDTTH